MVKKNSILKKTALLLTLTAVSFSLAACGNTSKENTSKPAKETSQPSDNDKSKQDDGAEDEKTGAYTYSSDKYYHLDPNCKNYDEEPMTLVVKAAKACGYEPCPKCAGGSEENTKTSEAQESSTSEESKSN